MIDPAALSADYLSRGNHENSNNCFTTGGLSNYFAEAASKELWREILPDEAIKAHDRGAIHIHDMGGGLKPYCGGFTARKILSTGLNAGISLPVARPPKHFHAAVDQLTNFMGLAAQELAGAVALADFDVALAPFVREDNLRKDDLKKTLVSLVYTLNMPTRFGQTPFTNLGLAPSMPEAIKDDPVTIAGEMRPYTYGDLEAERQMVAEALLEILLEGQPNGREFTFPIISAMVDPDVFPWDSEYARLLGAISAKYGNNNWLNMGEHSPYNIEDAFSSCCRLMLDTSALEPARGGAGSFMSLPDTGAQGVVTLNLAYIGASHGRGGYNSALMHRLLDQYLEIAHEALITKRRWLEAHWDLFPVIGSQLDNLNNHFDVVGIVGGAEMLRTIFPGEVHVYDPEGEAVLHDIIDHILARLDEWPGHAGLEFPPCEGATGRLARRTKEMFPWAFVHGETPDEYYLTPATYVPGDEWENLELPELLENQSPLHAKATSGTALHVYSYGPRQSGEEVLQWTKKIFENYSVPHLTWNPRHGYCSEGCGYLEGWPEECPHCGAPAVSMVRVLGYAQEVVRMNKSKRAEARDRSYNN